MGAAALAAGVGVGVNRRSNIVGVGIIITGLASKSRK